jgi:hypothetical protein
LTELTNVEESLYSEVFNVFSGENREWSFVVPPARFTKPFAASSVDEIMRRKNSLFGPNQAELHMSVETFVCVGYTELDLSERLDWLLIFDFDYGEPYEGLDDGYNKKVEASNQVSSILDKFGFLYFKDSRNHLWIPSWQSMKVLNWNNLFGSEFAFRLHQYLVNVCKLPEGIHIDSNLWKASRHKIRAPYSMHMETGKRQVLYFNGTEIRPEELSYYWNGKFLSREERKKCLDAFENFVRYSDLCGQQIIEATTKENEKEFRLSNSHEWIEKLLQMPVPTGFRGMFLWLVIMPYLVNVKCLSEKDVILTIENWLDKSNGNRVNDRDLYYYPKSRYKRLSSNGILPISRKNLMLKYPELYQVVRGV